jgi:hypothetical protein
MNCPKCGEILMPMANSEHYRCKRCFENNDGDDCEWSAFQLIQKKEAPKND